MSCHHTVKESTVIIEKRLVFCLKKRWHRWKNDNFSGKRDAIIRKTSSFCKWSVVVIIGNWPIAITGNSNCRGESSVIKKVLIVSDINGNMLKGGVSQVSILRTPNFFPFRCVSGALHTIDFAPLFHLTFCYLRYEGAHENSSPLNHGISKTASSNDRIPQIFLFETKFRGG